MNKSSDFLRFKKEVDQLREFLAVSQRIKDDYFELYRAALFRTTSQCFFKFMLYVGSLTSLTPDQKEELTVEDIQRYAIQFGLLDEDDPIIEHLIMIVGLMTYYDPEDIGEEADLEQEVPKICAFFERMFKREPRSIPTDGMREVQP